MSKTTSYTCNGCGRSEITDSTLYLPGWMRLTVTGRRRGDPAMNKVATVDVCSAACAPSALAVAEERVTS